MRNTVVAVACVVGAVACSKGGGSADDPKKNARTGSSGKLQYPVDVMELTAEKQQYTVDAPCDVDAYQVVQITARVAGAVDQVNFVEGADVTAGQVLATIEPERYRIAVQVAKAALDKAVATEKSAELAYQRRLTAQKESPGVVAGEEVEEKQTAVTTAKADIDAAKEALETAQLDLKESSVTSPIKGVVQSRTVQQGQYLQPGAVLATLIQRFPMLLRAEVSEADAPRLHPGMEANVTLRESKMKYTAKLTLIAGAADDTTRMVPITAEFDVDEKTEHTGRLRKGAFCQVSIPVGAAHDAIIVPSLAIAPTEAGYVVYIVDPKGGTVHQVVVETGMHTSDGGIELTRGVTAGQTMVVRGIEPLSEGAPIVVDSTLTEQQALQPPVDAGVASPPVTPNGSASAPSAGSAAAPAGAAAGR
jgi:membrane fusion protein, multidrug efflux system